MFTLAGISKGQTFWLKLLVKSSWQTSAWLNMYNSFQLLLNEIIFQGSEGNIIKLLFVEPLSISCKQKCYCFESECSESCLSCSLVSKTTEGRGWNKILFKEKLFDLTIGKSPCPIFIVRIHCNKLEVMGKNVVNCVQLLLSELVCRFIFVLLYLNKSLGSLMLLCSGSDNKLLVDALFQGKSLLDGP